MNILKIDQTSSFLKATINNLLSVKIANNHQLSVISSVVYQMLPCPYSEKVTIQSEKPLVARIIKNI